MSIHSLARATARGLVCIACVAAMAAVAQPIPDHPGKLLYGELVFNPPSAEEIRTEPGNGLVVYALHDPTLPLFSMSLVWPGGTYDDPPGQEGLRAITAQMMRLGGTADMTPEALDERLEYLSASIGSWAGLTTSGASCSCLSRDADELISLLGDVLFEPRFDEERLRLRKEDALESLRRRYDSVDQVLGTMRPPMVYGDTPWGRIQTATALERIDRDSLTTCHGDGWVPCNVIVMVSGRFDKEAMPAKIQALLARRVRQVRTLPPRETRTDLPGAVAPGVYLLDKKMPQAAVEISHLGIERHHPDYLPLQIMNRILGGGGFSSRVVRRVRSDEGLAYGVGTFVSAPAGYTGRLGASLQCAAPNAAYASSLIINELRRIAAEPVTDEELADAKDAYLESFPAMFQTSSDTVQRLGGLEIDELPRDYYHTLREQLRAVSKEDIQRVAREHIRPEALRIIIAADADLVRAGNPAYPVSIQDLGEVHVIAPSDPLEGK